MELINEMDSNSPFFYTPPQTILTDSSIISPDHDMNIILNQTTQGFDDQNLLEFMLFNGGGSLIDAADFYPSRGFLDPYDLQIDAFSGSPTDARPVISEGAHDHDEDDEKDHEHGDDFSPPATSQTRRDRSKTLVAERKRRVRMKDKLYELRSLVPNITKMDKASIIADAVVYVKNLQSQAKKLMEEISMLESSPREDQMNQNSIKDAREVLEQKSIPIRDKYRVIQVNAHEVGERKFYVKVEGYMADGIPSSLYSAMESLSCFHLENSNFSLISDQRFVFTLTFHVRGVIEGMDSSTMRLWVMIALLKEGFEIEKAATLLINKN